MSERVEKQERCITNRGTACTHITSKSQESGLLELVGAVMHWESRLEKSLCGRAAQTFFFLFFSPSHERPADLRGLPRVHAYRRPARSGKKGAQTKRIWPPRGPLVRTAWRREPAHARPAEGAEGGAQAPLVDAIRGESQPQGVRKTASHED